MNFHFFETSTMLLTSISIAIILMDGKADLFFLAMCGGTENGGVLESKSERGSNTTKWTMKNTLVGWVIYRGLCYPVI